MQNLAPGVIDKLGFAPAALRARDPRLITCSISGYGLEGPYRDLKAYDLLVQAESGLSAITGNDHGMARVGVSVCDISAGMTAYQAVLQAIIGRMRSGEGRHIDVSLFHALADWMNVPYLQYVYGGKDPTRSGLNHPTIAPYGAYTCGDGSAVLFSIQNEREWANLCRDVLLQPEVATDPRFVGNSARVAHRDELDAIVSAAFAAATRDEMIERLERARIAYGRVSSMADLAAHPQNRYVTVDTPSGPVRYLAPAHASTIRTRHSGPYRPWASTTQACGRSSPPGDVSRAARYARGGERGPALGRQTAALFHRHRRKRFHFARGATTERRAALAQPACPQHGSGSGRRAAVSNGTGRPGDGGGATLLAHARDIVARFEEAERAIRDTDAEPAGEVAIGLPSSIAQVLGAPLVRSARAELPRVRLRVAEAMSGYVLDWLRQGRVDLGLLYAFVEDRELRSTGILTETLVLFGATGEAEIHGMSPPGRSVGMAQLAGLPLILPSPGHGLRDLVDDQAARAKVSLTTGWEIDAYGAIKSLVADGLGFSVLPDHSVAAEVAAGALRSWAFEPAFQRTVHIVEPADRPLTTAMRAVERLCRRTLRDLVRAGAWGRRGCGSVSDRA
ncbi:CoA transferase [Sphingomonas sp. I4]